MISKPSRLGGILFLWMAVVAPGVIAGGDLLTPDASFQPAFTTTRGAALYAVTLQPDGRVVVAGDFSLVSGVPRRSLARLEVNGSLDPSFDARGGVEGVVYDLAVQPDGAIVLAGSFSAVDGIPRTGLARLLPDGRLDPGFHPDLAGRPGWFASAVLVAPDGHLVVAGRFETVAGVHRDGVAGLRGDGSLDPAFDPGNGLHGGTAYDLALQADGRVLMAGAFATVDSVFSPGVARLNPDGRVDTSFIGGVFSGGTWGRVYALAVQPGVGIVVAGEFDTVDLQPRNRIARLQFDGSLDPSFDPGEGISGGEETVFDLLALGSGQVVVTGRFESAAGAERSSLAGLAATGAPDAEFNPGPGLESIGTATGSMLALQPDGRVIAVGEFRTAAGSSRHCLARFLPDGSLDESFSTTNTFFEFGGIVNVLAPLPEGGWLVGGDFERVNGSWRHGLARVDAVGRLDTGFEAGLNTGAVVNAIARDAGGRFVIGGVFESVAGFEQANLTRLDADGSRDDTFLTAGPDSAVNAVVIEPSGDVLVAGSFVRLDNLRRLGLARLNAEGGVVPEFDARFEMELDRPFLATLALQPDGAILAGGRFTLVNGEVRRHLARLQRDGSLDAVFAAELQLGGADASVDAIAVLSGGRVLVGGGFTTVNGISQTGLTRLRPDGSVDTTFQAWGGVAGGADTQVRALAVMPDGRLAVGGEFAAYGGKPAANLAFLNSRGGLLAAGGACGTDGAVAALAVTTSGQLVAGGSFGRVGGATHLALTKFAVMPAGPEFYVDIFADADGRPVVEWEGTRKLQESLSPAGPWTEVPGAASPYLPDPAAGPRYYRLLQE